MSRWFWSSWAMPVVFGILIFVRVWPKHWKRFFPTNNTEEVEHWTGLFTFFDCFFTLSLLVSIVPLLNRSLPLIRWSNIYPVFFSMSSCPSNWRDKLLLLNKNSTTAVQCTKFSNICGNSINTGPKSKFVGRAADAHSIFSFFRNSPSMPRNTSKMPKLRYSYVLSVCWEMTRTFSWTKHWR